MKRNAIAAGLLLMIFGTLMIVPSLFSQFQDSSGMIRLQMVSFDPLRQPSLAQGPEAIDKNSLYLVQFIGPVREEWKQNVEQTGARLYGYIPQHAFIAHIDPTSLDKVRGLAFVRWVGPYQPAFKVSPGLAGPSLQSSEPVEVLIQTLPDSDLAALEARLTDMGATLHGDAANAIAGYVHATLPAARLAEVSGLDGVIWVERYNETKVTNAVGGGRIMRVNEVRQSVGLFGSGQIVAVADTGLDSGNLNTLHPDVRGRVNKGYALGRPDAQNWSDSVGHGTHVVGSVLGNGAASGSNPAAHSYNGTYAGTAPEARLVFQALADDAGALRGIPNDRGDLMRQAYADGARIHTNSWGGPTGSIGDQPQYGGYVFTSQQVDQAAWEHKDMLILYAAGNEGADTDANGVIDPDSIGQPGTAKNIITVGASETDIGSIANVWGDSYGSPIREDRRANNPNGMAAFSSRGPADDGRIKPEIVAPGTFIASLRSQNFVLNDGLEGDTSNYLQGALNGGTSVWQLAPGDGRNGSRSWRQSLNGNFNPGAMNAVLTPPANVLPVGGAFNLSFWHKYALSGNDELVLILMAPNVNGSGQTLTLILDVPATGTQGDYVQYSRLLPASISTQSGTFDTRALRIGFAIYSQDATYSSTWSVDDLRIEGASWSSLGAVGQTQPGSQIDEAYVMEGGTSMATPLTAGASALVREWLTRSQGVANPSSALMKGILINGAADMGEGQYGGGATREIPAQRPNNTSGWGRVDLVQSLIPGGPRKVWFVDENTGIATGATGEHAITLGRAPGIVSDTSDGAAENTLVETPTPVAEKPAALGVHSAPSDADRVLAKREPGMAASRSVPQATTQLIQNGGFETNASWTMENAGYSAAQHFSGTRSMGFNPGVDATFYQPVAIPAGTVAGTLKFAWKNIDPDFLLDELDVCLYTADLSDTYGCSVDTYSSTGTDWQQESLNIDALVDQIKGKTVNVVFSVTQDGLSPDAAFFVDDVSFVVDDGAVIPTVTRTTGPTVTRTTGPTVTRTTRPTVTTTGEPTVTTTEEPTVTTTKEPTVTTTSEPTRGGTLRVMLTWTDFPGQPASAKALVNDLDLEVIAPDGTHYYGNQGVYDSGQCLRDGKFDACNNAEGVIIPEALNGDYRVLVHGAEVAQGGQQPYAVVVSGDYARTTGTELPPAKFLFMPMVSR